MLDFSLFGLVEFGGFMSFLRVLLCGEKSFERAKAGH
jgi:hypothetical protein